MGAGAATARIRQKLCQRVLCLADLAVSVAALAPPAMIYAVSSVFSMSSSSNAGPFVPLNGQHHVG